MAFKLTKEIMDYVNSFVNSFDKDLIPVFATNDNLHWYCNGCSGDCNMTCKGGCGSKHG